MSFFDAYEKPFPLTSVSDYRFLAEKRLPKYLFDFIDGGAFDELTRKSNTEDFQLIQLRKRILKDVTNIDTEVEVLGQKLSQPLILAPIGFAGIYARRGEVQAARAAELAKIPFTLSTVSICSIEEVQKSTSTPFWYQFYMLKDKKLALDLLNCAKNAGCPVLLLTVDLPKIGSRHRYSRSMKFNRSIGQKLFGYCDIFLNPKWFFDVWLRGGPLVLGDVAKFVPHLTELPSMRKWMSAQLSSSLNWQDLEWLRAHWPGKIVLKGVLDVEDAHLAVKSGMDGIVVSNHGARHLDCTPSTISVLPDIVREVGNRIDVLIDGGISSSLDIVKALALGAKACMIGRSWAFALAARGQAGVSEILSIFQQDLISIMAQLGVTRIKDIDHKNIILKKANRID
jgi:L-lactate dehydrogenase (cytochrome)